MKKFFAFATLVLMASFAFGAQPVTLVSYPTHDSGWAFTGNVAPLNCAVGPCYYYLPFGNGQNSLHQHQMFGVLEGQGPFDVFQLQSNGNTSFGTLTFTVPTTASYTIMIGTWGMQGTNGHYPQLFTELDSVATNMCKYPGKNAITPTNTLNVDNGGFGIMEYVSLCPVTLSAGTHTLGINFIGGSNSGGSLYISNVILYPTSATLTETCTAINNGRYYSNSTLTGADPFVLNTACRTYINGLGLGNNTIYNNLKDGAVDVNGGGCFLPGGNTASPYNCGMFDSD